MPGSQHGPSIKNPRVYDALRRRGYSKQRAARISNAQRHKAAGVAPLAIPPTGPNALFNQPGIKSRRSKRLKQRVLCPVCRLKADSPASETASGPTHIAPGITRIRGNLCNVHGKYGRCPGSGTSTAKPRKGRKPAKPKKTPEERQAERDAQHAKNTSETLAKLNIAPDGQAALEALRKGNLYDEDAIVRGGFEQAGLVEQSDDGVYRLTASGRALLNAAAQGDLGRAGATISSARDRISARQQRMAERERKRQAKRTKDNGSPGDYLVVEDPKLSSKWHLQVKKNGQADHRLMGAAWAALHGGYRGNKYEGPKKTEALAKLKRLYAVEKMSLPSEKEAGVFSVFKDAKGDDRWLSITTTAYEDKDREIISCKAIAKTVAIGDVTEQRGPLRYWHVPGLDIGDCDFQAQGGPGGRFLIESGTFRSKACAAMGRTMAAKGYQMSPGFLHSYKQPIRGVFDDIAIVERSPVPAGRASNLFTRYLTKEDRMLTAEKETELKSLLADQPDLLQELLTRVETTDKAAQDAKIAYKDAPEWAQALINRIDALEATTKAMAPASMEEAADTEMADAETEQMDDGGVGEPDGDENMLTPSEIGAIASAVSQAVVQAIGPMLDLEKKMASHMADLKSSFGAMTATKDAAQSERVEKLEAQVKELVGDLPSSVLAGAAAMYRPSQATNNLLPPQAVERIKSDMGNAPSNLNPAEKAAYNLIFGDS